MCKVGMGCPSRRFASNGCQDGRGVEAPRTSQIVSQGGTVPQDQQPMLGCAAHLRTLSPPQRAAPEAHTLVTLVGAHVPDVHRLLPVQAMTPPRHGFMIACFVGEG